jgi:hypothetical protein
MLFQSSLIFQLHVTEISAMLSLFYFHEYYDIDSRLLSSLSSLLLFCVTSVYWHKTKQFNITFWNPDILLFVVISVLHYLLNCRKRK